MLPQLTGLDKARAEKRLAEAGTAQYALAFDGVTSHAPVNFAYDGSLPITLEAIVRRGQIGNLGAIVGNYDSDAERGGLGLAVGGATWFFRFAEANAPTAPRQRPGVRVFHQLTSRGPQRARPGTGWTHVAGVYDGRQLRLYVDGVLQETVAVNGPHAVQTKLPLVVGASPEALTPTGLTVKEFFQGEIKAVRISSTARYTANFTPPDELRCADRETALLLVFDKGSGTTVEDASGHKATTRDGRGRKKTAPIAAMLKDTRWVKLE